MKYRIIDDIVKDTKNGSIDLALKVLNFLPKITNLKDFAVELRKARPTMAAFLNIAHYLDHYSDAEARHWAKNMIKKIENIEELIGKRVREIIGDVETVTTISSSRTVLGSIRFLKPKRVFVLRSLPGGEGVPFAKKLMPLADVKLLDDLEMVSALRESDAALSGADCVSPSGVVNKIGTLPLAIVSKFYSIPFYVVSEEIKTVNIRCDIAEERFEFVPIELVKAVITEEGQWSLSLKR